MTRLLVVASLTSEGVGAVHFIDGNHASFEYSHTPKTNGGLRGLRREGGDGGLHPLPVQVGVLRLDDYGNNNQFVVSSDQSLAERLVVSGPVTPLLPQGAQESRGGKHGGVANRGNSLAAAPRGFGRSEGGTECVKFVAHVGTVEEEEKGMDEWFPGEKDARDLLRALDNFCPIPWLRAEEEGGLNNDEGGEDIDASGGKMKGVFVGRGGDGGGVGATRRGVGVRGLGWAGAARHQHLQDRTVVIYQRDRNRRLLETEQASQ